jgi:hypothetical protein
MSRIAITCSLLVTLTTGIASARSFARPPDAVPPVPQVTQAQVQADDLPPPVRLDRAELRKKLAERRKTNLNHFHAYLTAGVYPANTFAPGEANVWRDAAGRFCAAATIIRRSGDVLLVDKVAEQNNFIKLADVHQGPLMDWMLTSGLTQEEVALIQRPFSRVGDIDEDGTVRIDRRQQLAETRRLMGLYRVIAERLAADGEKSLDVAVDRLMKSTDNASRLMRS